jgi:hypothetical protein
MSVNHVCFAVALAGLAMPALADGLNPGKYSGRFMDGTAVLEITAVEGNQVTATWTVYGGRKAFACPGAHQAKGTYKGTALVLKEPPNTGTLHGCETWLSLKGDSSGLEGKLGGQYPVSLKP